MKKVFAPSIFALLSVACLVCVNFGCSVGEVKPDPEIVTSTKPQESIFTIIELEDAEYPTVEASIHLPFRVRPNNTVVISGNTRMSRPKGTCTSLMSLAYNVPHT